MCLGKVPVARGTASDYKRQFVPCHTRAGMTPGSQEIHNAVMFVLGDYPPAWAAAQNISTALYFSRVEAESLNK